jgi:hypothetical protein
MANEVFDILDRTFPWDKGRLHRTIIDHKGEMVDIEFEIGCLKPDGTFHSVGLDKLPLKDKKEERDMTTGKITQRATTDYTDFLAKFAKAGNPDGLAIERLENYGIKRK